MVGIFNISLIFFSLSGCGGTLTAPSGEIMSPHYPQNYPPNIVCYYKIRVNPGNRIKLVFVDFDVSLCEYNYLEVLTKIEQNYAICFFFAFFLIV